MNSTIPTSGKPRTPRMTILYDSAMFVVIMPYRLPFVSYSRAHFSFGAPRIHWEKGLTIGAALSVAACFAVNLSSIFQSALNLRCWFAPHNLLNRSIRSLFPKWLWKFVPICLMHHRFWTSGHFGGDISLPCWSLLMAAKIPLWLSLIKQIFGLVPTTCSLTCSRNQYQLSSFSLSTNANATGINWWLPSTPIAVRIVPLYFPVKKVPSMQSKGRQYWKALTHAPRQKNTRWRMAGPPSKFGNSFRAKWLPGFLSTIIDSMRGRLSYDAL